MDYEFTGEDNVSWTFGLWDYNKDYGKDKDTRTFNDVRSTDVPPKNLHWETNSNYHHHPVKHFEDEWPKVGILRSKIGINYFCLSCTLYKFLRILAKHPHSYQAPLTPEQRTCIPNIQICSVAGKYEFCIFWTNFSSEAKPRSSKLRPKCEWVLFRNIRTHKIFNVDRKKRVFGRRVNERFCSEDVQNNQLEPSEKSPSHIKIDKVRGVNAKDPSETWKGQDSDWF